MQGSEPSAGAAAITLDEYQRVVPDKIELINGNLLASEEARLDLLALLLKKYGLERLHCCAIHSTGATRLIVPATTCSSLPQYDGHLAFTASFWVDTYLQTHPIGRIYYPAPRFVLRDDPPTNVAPAVAYISVHRLAQFAPDDVYRVVPDLIMEVLSHPSHQDEIDRHVADFLAAGTQIAWIIDACDRTCWVRRRNGQEKVYSYNEKIYSASVLPRLSLRVYEIFE